MLTDISIGLTWTKIAEIPLLYFVLCIVCCIYVCIMCYGIAFMSGFRILKVTITTYHNMTNNIENTQKHVIQEHQQSTITAHSLTQLFARMAKPKSGKIILTTFITN